MNLPPLMLTRNVSGPSHRISGRVGIGRNPLHCLGVAWMRGEYQRDRHGRPAMGEHQPRNGKHRQRRQRMQGHVDQMVALRFETKRRARRFVEESHDGTKETLAVNVVQPLLVETSKP